MITFIPQVQSSSAKIIDALGMLPEFFSVNDPRSAREQLNDAYAHGGGWSPLPGFKLSADYILKYPGDPPMKPLAAARLRDEEIIIYPHAWVCIKQSDGTFEVARID